MDLVFLFVKFLVVLHSHTKKWENMNTNIISATLFALFLSKYFVGIT